MFKRIKELRNYKELIWNFTSRDLKLKYKNSALGFIWSLLNPLMMMVVYTIAFKFIMKQDIENFSMYILTGILPWSFFQASIIGGTRCIIDNAQLVKKVYFPREIIPFSMVLTNMINYLITLVIVFLGLFISKIHIGPHLLLLPIVLLLFFIFTYGLVLLLSSLDVIYRDIFHFVEVVFMAWIYLTPVVYTVDQAKELKWLFYFNPMYYPIQSIRDTLMYDRISYNYLLAMALIAFVTLFVGYKSFIKIEKVFAEEI
ncbi:ABC transporter permease [Clostridium cellulovorans]|uniref:Transport permease protein n=1 Tax=Clostridium cellulovorans (strain ATCC 35296 / DSM 3052 / OCM 3 / 743B) TaxID=573061 RepID=D9SRL2_CLOC7|nr:ABC transporter permease [Clostridium cellulovorans]ADL50379.1 ABC-2 type transporter [Clostridium cellulovorans 743B]